MKFRYARYGSALRPVIPVKVKNGANEMGYQVLVDSGADLCLFHEHIGEAVGIDVKKGKVNEVTGIGGKSALYYLHKVTVEVGGWPYEIEAGFMPLVGTAIMPYGVVGQRGFFDIFVVKFDLLKEEI